jgi:DNA polymerase-3 subunit beta
LRIVGEKEAFADAGQAVLRVVAARATLPVLGGIRISASDDGVEFAGTDLEIFVRVKGEFAVEEKGTTVVPGRLFGDIVRSLQAGRVTMSASDSEVRLEGGRSEFSLNTLPVADFPETPEIAEASVSRVAGSDLARALRQVVKAASTDEARPILTGVLWAVETGSLRLVATDSYRLTVRELTVKEGPSEGKSIVPGRALGEFGRHLAGIGDGEAEIRLGESQAEFVVGTTRLVTRLIEGEFPNYRQLLPEGYLNRLSVSREGLLEAVERVGLVAQTNTPLRLHLEEDEIRVTAIESGVAEAWETVGDANYSGEAMVISFNPRFLADGLEVIDSEKALLEFANDPLKPVLIKGDGREDFVYLVMPVRPPRQ